MLALALWLGIGAAAFRRHSLRDFDAHAVARLETATWRSYYDHRPVRLFLELTQLLRTQYHLSFVDSLRAALVAATAAERFQPGHTRADDARALPDLERFYAIVGTGSDTALRRLMTRASRLGTLRLCRGSKSRTRIGG